MIYKTLHRKPKIDQHEKQGVNYIYMLSHYYYKNVSPDLCTLCVHGN